MSARVVCQQESQQSIRRPGNKCVEPLEMGTNSEETLIQRNVFFFFKSKWLINHSRIPFHSVDFLPKLITSLDLPLRPICFFIYFLSSSSSSRADNMDSSTFFFHPSSSSITPGRPARLHPVSAQSSCWSANTNTSIYGDP